jgi:hypothetical protein
VWQFRATGDNAEREQERRKRAREEKRRRNLSAQSGSLRLHDVWGSAVCSIAPVANRPDGTPVHCEHCGGLSVAMSSTSLRRRTLPQVASSAGHNHPATNLNVRLVCLDSLGSSRLTEHRLDYTLRGNRTHQATTTVAPTPTRTNAFGHRTAPTLDPGNTSTALQRLRRSVAPDSCALHSATAASTAAQSTTTPSDGTAYDVPQSQENERVANLFCDLLPKRRQDEIRTGIVSVNIAALATANDADRTQRRLSHRTGTNKLEKYNKETAWTVPQSAQQGSSRTGSSVHTNTQQRTHMDSEQEPNAFHRPRAQTRYNQNEFARRSVDADTQLAPHTRNAVLLKCTYESDMQRTQREHKQVDHRKLKRILHGSTATGTTNLTTSATVKEPPWTTPRNSTVDDMRQLRTSTQPWKHVVGIVRREVETDNQAQMEQDRGDRFFTNLTTFKKVFQKLLPVEKRWDLQ